MSMRSVFVCALIGTWCLTVVAQTQCAGERSAKNLIDDACRTSVKSLLSSSGISGSSNVFVAPGIGERALFFRSLVIDAITAYSGTVFTELRNADTVISIGIEDVSITYSPIFREVWFGEKKTERTASVAVRFEMQQRSSGILLCARTVCTSLTDTVAVDAIARLGASARHIAFGEPPGPSVWERILEPVLLTISSGVVIYLFFTVRS